MGVFEVGINSSQKNILLIPALESEEATPSSVQYLHIHWSYVDPYGDRSTAIPFRLNTEMFS